MKIKTDINERKAAKRRLILDTLIIVLIILSPFAYRIHEYIPDGEDATLSFFGFIIDSNGFIDLKTYVWFLIGKLVPLSLLLIWFFTSKNWWYHIILIPILMYAFQIFEVVYSENNFIDTKNILWLLPVCAIIVPFVYLIRIKLYDKHVHGIDLEAIDAELEALKTKKDIREANSSNEDFDNLNQESLADELDRKLSTHKIEQAAKQFQTRLQNLVNLNNK